MYHVQYMWCWIDTMLESHNVFHQGPHVIIFGGWVRELVGVPVRLSGFSWPEVAPQCREFYSTKILGRWSKTLQKDEIDIRDDENRVGRCQSGQVLSVGIPGDHELENPEAD